MHAKILSHASVMTGYTDIYLPRLIHVLANIHSPAVSCDQVFKLKQLMTHPPKWKTQRSPRALSKALLPNAST